MYVCIDHLQQAERYFARHIVDGNEPIITCWTLPVDDLGSDA